jgi:membrane protein YdbS with pleckstrin-like domain
MEETNKSIYRKNNIVFIIWWILFSLILIVFLYCYLNAEISEEIKNLCLILFIILEVVIIVIVARIYLNTLTISKNGITLESWILVKNKTEILYNKINTVKTYSLFWLSTLEITLNNDKVITYKFLDRCEEVEKKIKEHINTKD